MADINSDDYITPLQAAVLRGVSKQRINTMIKQGLLMPTEIAGKRFLRRQDVLNLKKGTPGRPRKLASKREAKS